jgi:hypothetical protein
MNILNDKSDITFVLGVDIEMVQQQKQEYHLIDTFIRSKGLNLYFYNPANGETQAATIKYSDTLHIYKLSNGKWLIVDWEAQKCTVNSICIYFEALNLRSALERVVKWKHGKVKELCNLRKPNKEGIKFF